MATTRKSSPSKSSPSKSGPRKTASSKSASSRSGARKTSPSRSAESADSKSGEAGASSARRSSNGGPDKPTKRASALQIGRLAAQQLAELTGRVPECVIGIERAEEGWLVELEVVESRRIPDSTDILATYRVEVDADGELMGYHRAQRYVRGKSGSGDGGGR